MHNFVQKLKQKGPGGIPIGLWAAIIAVALYLGYRWYQNRSGSSSSSNTSGNSAPVDLGAGIPPDQSTTGDVTPQDQSATSPDVAPPASSTTNVVPDTSTSTTEPSTSKKKKPKKKGHTSLHDHRQRLKHTARKALPKRKNGHAPKVNKNPHSGSKRQVVRNVPTAVRQARVARAGAAHSHAGDAGPSTIVKQKVSSKSTPPPLARHEETKVAPKPPLHKRRR